MPLTFDDIPMMGEERERPPGTIVPPQGGTTVMRDDHLPAPVPVPAEMRVESTSPGLAEGGVLSFDDIPIQGETPEEPIPEQAQQPNSFKPVTSESGEFDSFLLSTANSLLGNFGSEAAGAIGGAIEFVQGGNFSEGFERDRAAADRMLKGAAEMNPKAAFAGDVTGIAGSLMVPGGAALKGAGKLAKVANFGEKATKATRAATGVGIGATSGGIYGFGEDGTIDERFGTAKDAAIVGGVTGLVAPGLGTLIGKVSQKLTNKANPIPANDELQAIATKFYDDVRADGITIHTGRMNQMIDNLDSFAVKLGVAKGTKVGKLAKSINDMRDKLDDGPPSFDTLDTMRRMITKNFGKTKEVNGVTNKILKKFDNMVDNLRDGDIINGSGKDAAYVNQILKDGRAISQRAKKNDTIQRLITKAEIAAQDSTLSARTHLRKQFKKLQNSDDYHQFNAAEKKAINQLAKFGFGEGVEHVLNKIMPSSSMTVIGALISAPTFGAGALAIPAAVGGTALLRGGLRAANKAVAKNKANKLTRQVTTGTTDAFKDTPMTNLIKRRQGLLP